MRVSLKTQPTINSISKALAQKPLQNIITDRVMTLGYLPENGDFVVFLRLTTNSAYLYTSQRREKDEQHILKIL